MKKSKKIMTYTVVFEQAIEGGYVAYVPLLPGCVSQGETFEKTRSNIQDAIKGYLLVLRQDGDEMPEEGAEHIVAQVAAHAI